MTNRQFVRNSDASRLDFLNPRHLQAGTLNYTHPPTEQVVAATPEAYRSDEVIDSARQLDGNNNCSPNAPETRCHIPFEPSPDLFHSAGNVGVLFHPGALVDPRA
jgi:hypothetical protein